MSQSGSKTSFLDDVSSWSVDICRERLSETLPKLISQYCNGGSVDIKTAILRVMVGSFLPCLDLQNLEDQFFTKVLPQTCQLFDDALMMISTTIQDTSTQEDSCHLKEKLQAFLQITLDVIESLGSCISHVNTLCGGALSIGSVQSLPSSVLHVVRESFHHCKDSTSTYGDHFPLVSEILSSLFKKAYSLQKSLTILLDAVQLTSGDGEECIEAVVQLCSGFHDLCIIIGNMDSTLLVSTWRFLVKMASKHKELLKNLLPVHPIIATLCSDIKSNYEQCLRLAPHPPSSQSSQGGDEKAFGKTLKICTLCIKMLMHLLKEFDGYLGPCQKELYDLVLVLQSLAPPSIHAPSIFSSARDEIDRALLICVEPLLQQLMDNSLFRDAVTATKQDIPSNLHFGRLLTLVKILKILPSCQEETRTAWMNSTTSSWEEPRDSVLQAVFRSCSSCFVELALPVKLPILVSQGQPQQDVNLREYLAIHLCSFVASVSTRQFGVVERCLLENVVSNELNSALLAMDVWCFLARYGTADLCASHVHLVADLLTSIPASHNSGYVHLSMLLWRLVPLMAQEHQADLLNKFPPKKHCTLWRHLPLAAFQEDKRNVVAEDLVSNGLEQCDTLLDSREHTFSSLDHLETALACISSVYRQFENSNPPISSQLTQRVMEVVVRLWEVLPLDRVKSHDMISTLIDMTGLMLTELHPGSLAKVTKHLCSMLQSASLKLKLDIVNLLHGSRRVKVQSCSQLSNILGGLAELFSGVLADKSYVIRQLALQAFSTFAEETAHESVVPECLHAESTHSRVVDFLNQVPQECTPAAKTEVEWLQEQAEALLHLAKDRAAQERMPQPASSEGEQETRYSEQREMGQGSGAFSRVGEMSQEECSKQPAAKRPKRGDSDEGYRQAIGNIRSSLQTIQLLRERDQGLTPAWLQTELQVLRDRITGMIPDS